MLSNPDMLRSMINNNPMLKQMVENNPEMAAALNDPAMLQMMSDPQVMNAAMGMMNRMGPNPLGAMMGGTGSFPQPGILMRWKKSILTIFRWRFSNSIPNYWNNY